MDKTDLAARLRRDQFPRSNGYDPEWIVENMMGPHPLWLMEHLTDRTPPRAGQRVMDLGCGKAITSVFLAREFDVAVHAVDLWIQATDNWPRIVEAGEGKRVVPIHADATEDLPFADGYFDSILSVDAYHYFGRDPEFLTHILRYLAPGGTVGIVVPSTREEVGTWPDSLTPYADDGFETFHSAEWWRELWAGSGLVTVEHAAAHPDGYELWLEWSRTWDQWTGAQGGTPFEREVAMLEADADRILGFACIVATKT